MADEGGKMPFIAFSGVFFKRQMTNKCI